MYEYDILIILGLVTIVFSWLDIFDVSLLFRKIILCLLMVLSLYAGYINFPNSADFGIYNVMYFAGASDQFIFSELKDGIIDYGFLWFWTIIKSVGGDIYNAYFVTCAISLFFYYISITRYTAYILTVWSLFYVRFFLVCNVIQIRQGLAMALILFGVQYVERKCFLKYLLVVLVASLIHKTMIVTILLYPLSFINWNISKFFSAIVFFTLPLVAWGKAIFFYMILAVGIGAEKLYAYEGSMYFVEASNLAILMRGLPILLCAYYLMLIKKEKYTNTFISMLFCGYLFVVLSKELAILGRVTSVFFLCMNFMPMYLLYRYKKISHKLFIMLLISLFSSVLFLKNIVFFTSV